MEKGIGSRFSGWVRTPKRLSIPILGSVLIATLLVGVIAGTVLGESNLITRIFEEVRVAVTGRLPLEEWRPRYPTSYSEEENTWLISSSSRQLVMLEHRVSPPRVARELELELQLPSEVISGEETFSFWVEVVYADATRKEMTFSAGELAAVARASGGEGDTAKLRFKLDDEGEVALVVLGVSEVEPDMPGGLAISIPRAQLVIQR